MPARRSCGSTDCQPLQRTCDAARLRQGSVLIEGVTTTDGGKEISIPDGLVHHWIGLVFVPGATVDSAVALLQDYDRHAEIYKPAVARSRLLARNGDTFRVYLRFFRRRSLRSW